MNGQSHAGAVYIVHGGSAAPPATLTAPAPHHFGMFGRSRAAHGDLLAIGSPGDVSDGVNQAGRVYLARNGTIDRAIDQESKGIEGSSEPEDRFGSSIALGPLAGGRVGGAHRRRRVALGAHSASLGTDISRGHDVAPVSCA